MNFSARPSTPLAILLFALAISALSVRADELQDIDRLLKQGQHAQALERVNQYLSQRPKDAKGRFIKGLIVVEKIKVEEAFVGLAGFLLDYPIMPKRSNNIPYLYSAQSS